MLCLRGNNMKCPFCGHAETKVVDKRDREGMSRRRRECKKCQKRFTTYEKPKIEILVIKRDGVKEKYDGEKLKEGMFKACEKRPVTKEKINSAANRLGKKFRKKGGEIKSKKIGEEVMKVLKKIDEVAYIRFVSVYKDFKSSEDFKKNIEEL